MPNAPCVLRSLVMVFGHAVIATLLACARPAGDADGDGVDWDADCDDHDPAVTLGTVVWTDADADGWGDTDFPVQACAPDPSLATHAGDCDDADATVFPGAEEHCDARDEDCDDEIDETPLDGVARYADLDGDGYGAGDAIAWSCTAPSTRTRRTPGPGSRTTTGTALRTPTSSS